MNFEYTKEEQNFRNEVREWLKETLPKSLSDKVKKYQRLSKQDLLKLLPEKHKTLLQSSVYFDNIQVRKEMLWGEPAFFTFSTYSSKKLFNKPYEVILQEIIELMFHVNKKKQLLQVHTDHKILPTIFSRNNIKVIAPLIRVFRDNWLLYHPKI